MMISKIKRDAIIATQLHPLDPFMGTNTLSFALSVGSPDGTNITLSPLLYLYDPLMGQTSHSLLCSICRIPWWDKHHTLLCCICMIPSWDKHHTLSFAISVGSPDVTNITLSFAIHLQQWRQRVGKKIFKIVHLASVCPVREYVCVLWHACATIIISSLLLGTSHEKFKGHA